jgi:Flp pilus assembly protein TadD
MRERFAAVLVLLFTVRGAVAEGSFDAVVIGPNPDLVEGAEALQRGDFETGVRLTRAGLALAVTGAERAAGLNNLCAGYTALARYDLAIVHCTESLELDGTRWQPYSNRALAYLGKGMLTLARRDVTRGLELAPYAQRLLQVAALVQEAAGRARDAPEPDPIA